MKYLVKVYDRVDSAEVREDGTYDNDVFSLPEEGTASQKSLLLALKVLAQYET